MIDSREHFLVLVTKDDAESADKLRHDQASELVWWDILQSSGEYVRTVTLNNTLPDSILRHLASHADANVRSHIALKRRLPYDVFEKLASDDDPSVRARVSWNKKTPIEILQTLAADNDELVREPARQRLKQLGVDYNSIS